MEGRHKDFNNYLVKSGTIKALTKAFAKLFEMTDDDRPENAVWFVQQHMIDNDEVPTVDIIEYEKALNETKEIKVELLENQNKVADISAQSANNAGDVSKSINPKDGSDPNAALAPIDNTNSNAGALITKTSNPDSNGP